MYNKCFVFYLSIVIISGFFLNTVYAQEGESKKVSILQENVGELKKAFAEPDTSNTNLEEELAEELGVLPTKTEEKFQEKTAGISQETISARRSFFQNMNPNVSVIGTVLGHANTMDGLERNYDLGFQEGEFSFQAAVDPYAKADFFVAFHKHEHDILAPDAEAEHNEEEEHAGGLEPSLEEAYITFLALPFSTQLKAGKFRSKFGKINESHPHAYNFIDVPLMYSNFLSPDGLNDEGVALSWLLPHSAFYQELTLQVSSGPSENASFTKAEGNKLLYLAHLKNFFDVNENTTLELGVSALTGPHDEAGTSTQMFTGDLTLKWKPLQRNRYKSVEFTNEFLVSKRNETVEDITSVGFYSHLRYQFAKRWFIGGLFDYSEYPEFSEYNYKAYSGILQFFATEFQKVEFQFKYNDGNFFDSFSEFKLRAVFVIGAHGAHQY